MEKQVLVVENHLDFLDPADQISAAWSLTLDGTEIAGGSLPLPSIPPHTEREIPLSFFVPDQGRCFLKVTYVLKEESASLPAGHDLGFDEIRIPNRKGLARKAAALLEERTGDGAVIIREEGHFLILEGERFTYRLDTLSGLFTSLRAGGMELLDRPMDFNLWRAPTDNDAAPADLWKWERLDHTATRAYGLTWRQTEGRAEIKIRQSVGAMSIQPVLRMENQITVFPDGRIRLDVQAARDPEIETLPRIGLRLFLPGSMKQAAWFGMGPRETYIDKHHAGYHGVFRSSVAELQEDYIRPQENGSHYDCDYVVVKSPELTLTVGTGDPLQTFSFNASVYTQEELETKKHNYELEPCGSTVLCLDHKLAGIGSKSCGPDLSEKYRVCDDIFRFSFLLKPEEI